MSSQEKRLSDYGKNQGEAWILPFNAMTLNEDEIFVLDRLPPPSKHSFSCAGIVINVSLVSDQGGTTCALWSDIGEFPYTADCAKARAEGIAVLHGTRKLPSVRFCVAKKQRVCAFYESRVAGHVTLDALIVEILHFLQQSLPFVYLLKERVCTR